MFNEIIAILSNEAVFVMCFFIFLTQISGAILSFFFLKSIKGKKLNQLEEKYPKGSIFSVQRMWIFHPKGSIIFTVICIVIVSIVTIASFICNLLYNVSGLFSIEAIRALLLVFILVAGYTFIGIFIR